MNKELQIEGSIEHVHWHTVKGRYNLLSNENQISLSLTIRIENNQMVAISELWDIDDEPWVGEDDLPSTIVDIIEAKNKKLLYSSKREEMQKKVDWIRKNIKEIDSVFIQSRITKKRQQIKQLEEEIENLNDHLEEIKLEEK